MTTGISCGLYCCWPLVSACTPSDVYTMRNTNPEIPIRINDAKRPDIKELNLHAPHRDSGAAPGSLAGRARPEQQAFGFRANGDGIYWFSVCSIDKTGHRDPEDNRPGPGSASQGIDRYEPPGPSGGRGGSRR